MKTSGQSLLAALLLLAAGLPVVAAPSGAPAKPAATLPLSNPMVFYLAQGEPNSCGPGCDKWISAEGTITRGTAERMRAFLRRQTEKRPIYFYSPGGITSESLAMGRLMRERGVTARVGRTTVEGCEGDPWGCLKRKGSGQQQTARLTSIAAQCNSACVYAIVGARLREIAPEARLGVHASKTVLVGSLPKGFHVTAEMRARFKSENQHQIRRYLVEMGIQPGLLDAAEKIPNESIRSLSREEMVRFNIDTRKVVESGWVYDERINDKGGHIFKSIDMSEAGATEYRKTLLRVSCLAGKFVLGYVREVGPQENSFAPMRLVAASQEFDLPPPSVSVASDDAKRHYDVRRVTVPRPALESAAAEELIEIAPRSGDGKPVITRLSTLGLASALSSLTRNCDQVSSGGAALVPHQTP
jgi:hypothetical protein